jgi:hypothetical protein
MKSYLTFLLTFLLRSYLLTFLLKSYLVFYLRFYLFKILFIKILFIEILFKIFISLKSYLSEKERKNKNY